MAEDGDALRNPQVASRPQMREPGGPERRSQTPALWQLGRRRRNRTKNWQKKFRICIQVEDFLQKVRMASTVENTEFQLSAV